MIRVLLALISGLSFLHYGLEILTRHRLEREFERYGMPRIRSFVGAVEILGGAGVLIGIAYAPLGAFAAAGLTLLMILGLIVRLRLRDTARMMAPAASLGVVNAVLFVLFLGS